MAKSDELAEKAKENLDKGLEVYTQRGVGYAILALVAAIKEKEASDKDQFKLL